MKTIIAGIDKIEKAAQLIKDGQRPFQPKPYTAGSKRFESQAVKRF